MQKSKLIKFACSVIAATCLPSVAFAKADYKGDYKGEYVAAKKWSPTYYDSYMGIILGGGIGNVGDDNPTIVRGVITDEYPVTSNSAKSALIGLNAGYEFLYPAKHFSFAIGLGAYTSSAYKFKGNLVETIGAGTPTTLYNYKYSIASTRLMLEMQANWIFRCLAPFINAGVGPTWNRAKDYDEVANTIMAPPLAPFRDKTKMNMAYQVGGGISYLFNARDNDSPIPTERLTLGYQFVGLGDVKFRSRGNSAYPGSLDTGVFHTNEFYIRYTHYF